MLNPNIIGAIQSIPIAQVEQLEVVLDEKQPVIDEQHPIQIIDVSGLIIELEDKASLTQLQSETTQRINADISLNEVILLKASQLDLNAEITNRENANTDLQTEINLKLAESNSIHRDNYAFYCVDGRNDLHSVLPNVNNQGAYISVSSGSFGNTTPLTIDKDNLSMFSVPSTPPICEFACPLTIASTANRIRTRYMSFDGVCNLNGKRCVYTHSTFNNNVNIGAGTTEYMTFANCEFNTGNTITFSSTMASVVYIIECNIAGATLVFNNASPLQVIFSNCSGFQSFPTTSQATLIGLNVLATGISQHNISQIILPIGSGSSGQVLTSGGAGSVNSWSTPSSGGSSPIKESFTRYTQGQVVSTSKGNITLPNITTQQNVISNSLTWTELLGSSINYNPPTGSTFIEYEVDFNCYTFTPSVAQETFFSLALYIDNVEQKITRQRIILAGVPSGPGEKNYKFKTLISITGTTDPNKVSLNSWNTSRNVKIMLLKEQNNRNLTINFLSELYVGGGDPIQTTIIPPLLKITAY